MEGLRHGPPSRVDRGFEERGLRDAVLRRHRRGLDECLRPCGGGDRGRGRGAGQQRRLQPERRDRGGPDRCGAAPVRDQRVRSDADVPAGAARHAGAGLGQDRQRHLDGRQARLPGRRRLPRDQARSRSAFGCSALRGGRVRRRRGGDRAGADQDQLRRGGSRVDGRRAADRRALRGIQRCGQPRDGERLRGAPWPGWAAARRPWHGRSSTRSHRATRAPATR